MTEEIRDLIEKIHQEGLKAAEEKAQNIEAMARQRADEIISHARREAEEIIDTARKDMRREDEKAKAMLAQAGRDLLLSLRGEINAMLERIIFSDVQKALTPEAMFDLLTKIIQSAGEEKNDITVSLNKIELEIVENNFLNRLKEETKKKITLRPTEEISGGFTISYDGGRSCYDFTDKALAEYIGTYLKPKLNQILQDATKE
jgi:V/A-type H+-transporting ATPase subunit E